MSADSFVSAQGNGREEYNKEHKPEYEKLKKEREEKDSDEMIEQCITVSPSSMTVATCVYHCSPSAAPLQHGHVPVQPPLQPGLLTLLHQTAVVPHHHRCSALFCPTPLITLLARRDEVVPHPAVFSLFGFLLLTILIVRQLYLYNRDTRTEGVHQG